MLDTPERTLLYKYVVLLWTQAKQESDSISLLYPKPRWLSWLHLNVFILSPTFITKGAGSELSCEDCAGNSAQMHCTLCCTYANEFQHSCIPDEHQTLWWIVRTGIQIAMDAKINKWSNTKIIEWDFSVENGPLFSIPHAKATIHSHHPLPELLWQPSHYSLYLQSTCYTADIRIFLKCLPELVTHSMSSQLFQENSTAWPTWPTPTHLSTLFTSLCCIHALCSVPWLHRMTYRCHKYTGFL